VAFQEPTVTYKINWSNSTGTAASFQIKQGDTVEWSFDASQFAVVSRANAAAAAFSSLDTIPASDTPQMVTFRRTFDNVGTFGYFSPVGRLADVVAPTEQPLTAAFSGSIWVVSLPQLNTCYLNRTDLRTVDTLQSSATLAEVSRLELEAKQSLPVHLLDILEDSGGLCNQTAVADLWLLAHRQWMPGFTGDAVPVGAKIVVTAVVQVKGKFQVSLDDGKTWAALVASSSKPLAIAAASASRIRFVPDAHQNSLVKAELQYQELRDDGVRLSPVRVVATQTVAAVNDPPVLRDGPVVNDMDEDETSSVVLRGTNIAGESQFGDALQVAASKVVVLTAILSTCVACRVIQ